MEHCAVPPVLACGHTRVIVRRAAMRAGRASRTAEHNALFRALEDALPGKRRLFRDPLAAAALTFPLSLVARLGKVPGVRTGILRIIDGRWPGVRTSLVARTRLIDDAIVRALDEPSEQGGT